MNLEIENLFKIDKSHGISESEIKLEKEEILKFYKKIEARNQGFYKIFDDEKLLDEIEVFAKEVENKYKHIVVLGIGGSALGTICIRDALVKKQARKLWIIDNIDPNMICELEENIDYEKSLFLVVTKSGNTPETLAAYFYFRKNVEKQGLNVKNHFVFITDPTKGLLREIANKEGIKNFPIPENVGGRFSVLTSVGLVPAALMGVDIRKLMEGGKKGRDLFLSENSDENLSYQIAKIQFELNKKGKSMTVMMPYSHNLFRFADWYRQLLAESIGKEFADSGEKINCGITPINALGATDQHSQSQLYNEGPNDKMFIFLHVENFDCNPIIPFELEGNPEFGFLKNISFTQLLHTEFSATRDVLTKNNRPNLTLKIEQIDEYNLGLLFLIFEGSIAFLGEMFGVNAFDQPGVELAKVLTKEYLSRNS